MKLPPAEIASVNGGDAAFYDAKDLFVTAD